MKVLFLIQGEGNGHVTQAISLAQILIKNNHQVVAAAVGSASGTKIPPFFADTALFPVYTFKSPGLRYSSSGTLQTGATLRHFAFHVPAFRSALRQIHRIVLDTAPDLIVNFYELAGGLYNFFYRPAIPVICIAHQYLFLNPGFVFPEGHRRHRTGMNLLSRCTAYGAAGIYALSFLEMPSNHSNLRILPPLLREEVYSREGVPGDHVLVYITQPQLASQIVRWHEQHPTVPIHCFRNSPAHPDTVRIDDNLVFHNVNTSKFLDLLQSCKALVTTAGFESVCEAMILGKPVMMVPVPNHYEQLCNALDGARHGLGISHREFDISKLLEYLPVHRAKTEEARAWVSRTEKILLHDFQALLATAG